MNCFASFIFRRENYKTMHATHAAHVSTSSKKILSRTKCRTLGVCGVYFKDLWKRDKNALQVV